MGIRIHEARKKFNLSSKQMNDVLSNIGYTGSTNALAGLSDDIVAKIEKHLAAKTAPAEKPEVKKQEQPKQQQQQQQKPVPQKQEEKKQTVVSQNNQN
ncbi:MAG: hypothetical protein II567_11080, partial [Candidatus Riflebacteria bacterium]|nr:hypothetical protein [Candidatus Riflebacteria bacterium]